ncbi:hypothetical protein CIRG_08784 [Coccidioides immitis RMSCC 2394]|uniref:Uncharacterized protein n=1 Tax=Coccidioides immitis RMSCC 2394 TaxID=404692 RepID=A0A0J6YQ73_COCIT|nr:hypothetical protein CIRG_08784 [Coccidioides immitis RMSCC 2394]
MFNNIFSTRIRTQVDSGSGNMPLAGISRKSHTFQWPDILSRHDLNLRTHIQVCAMVKKRVSSNPDSVKVISSIIQATQQLMQDLEKIRDQLPLRGTGIIEGTRQGSQDARHTASRNAGGVAAHDAPVPDKKSSVGSDQQPESPSNKKRSYGEEEDENTHQQPREANSNKKCKRLCDTAKLHGDSESSAAEVTPYIPTIDVEDISEEVEARLRLKDEARRNRAGKKEKKRKRDSHGSATDSHSGPSHSALKRKKLNPQDGLHTAQTSTDNPYGSSKKARLR